MFVRIQILPIDDGTMRGAKAPRRCGPSRWLNAATEKEGGPGQVCGGKTTPPPFLPCAALRLSNYATRSTSSSLPCPEIRLVCADNLALVLLFTSSFIVQNKNAPATLRSVRGREKRLSRGTTLVQHCRRVALPMPLLVGRLTAPPGEDYTAHVGQVANLSYVRVHPRGSKASSEAVPAVLHHPTALSEGPAPPTTPLRCL